MKRVFAVLISVFALVFTVGSAFADEEHHHDAVSAEQLGNVSFPTSCAENAQKQFQRGVAWLYSFEYEQANNDFVEVAKADPSCAMAYWGQAMTLFHQLWARPSKDDVHKGADLLAQAAKLKPKTQRERDYIAALTLFYSGDDPEHYKNRLEAYSQAMDKLRMNNPKDHEAAVFYALSLLSQTDGKDPKLTLEHKAVDILNQLLPMAPNHPGITHYIIHATDNPQLAAMGLSAAREYAKVAPASVHAVHMPSHIFTRLGLWDESIKSNLAAIAIADQMTDLHMAHHRIHSMDFLEYAYLQIGDDQKAKAEVDELLKMKDDAMPAMYLDFLQSSRMFFPATYAIERKQWKEAAAIAPLASDPPFVQGIAYYSRIIAAGHLKDAAAAHSALDSFQAMIEATKKSDKAYMVDNADMVLDQARAWAAHADGKDDDAVALLRKVADKQDQVGKGETEIPAREMLADLLLELNRPEDALHEYESSLKTDPNRFNGLYGAARAASESKQPDKARQYYAQLLKNCSGTESDRPELGVAREFTAAK